MKSPEFLKNSWWWLSLLCFSLLLSLIYFEMGYFYPQAKRYFDNSGGPTAQPLISRARTYLFKSLEHFAEMSASEESSKKVRLNLNTAYGLINVDLYLKNYPCTGPNTGDSMPCATALPAFLIDEPLITICKKA